MHYICHHIFGDVAQLARALAWHARGRGFDSHLLHIYLFKTLVIQKITRVFHFCICTTGQLLLQSSSKTNSSEIKR